MSQDKLTKDQQQAVKDILAFTQDDRQAIILEGFAGTGKTFVINHVYEEYMKLSKLNKYLGINNKIWIFTATTHKAVASLSKSVNKPVYTTHSTFGISVNDINYRKEFYDENYIVVVDECSYLNYKQLEILFNNKCKFIFMGDRLQLPPVGLNHSPVFFMDIDTISLTTLVRQANAPLIADYCHQLRQAISDFKATPTIPNNSEIIHLDRDDFDKQLLQEFGKHRDCKYLCFKNSTVKKYNGIIQTHLTGSPSIKEGDLLVANAMSNLVRNNQYITVDTVEETIVGSFKGVKINSIYFVPNKASAFKKLDSHFLSDLRHTFASTIHKAQGSTYHSVFIDLNEFKQVKTREEINRLLYVAISRATHKIYLTGEIP